MESEVRQQLTHKTLKYQHRTYQKYRYKSSNMSFFSLLNFKVLLQILILFFIQWTLASNTLQFTQNSYKFNIYENNKLNQFIGQVKVNFDDTSYDTVHNNDLEFIMHVNDGDKNSLRVRFGNDLL